MSDFITKLSDLIDPEVMGDMVSARIPKKLRVAPFAKIDDTLAGVPGDTITVPAYTYIGDASDVAEGGEVAIEKMTTSTRKAKIKKAMKASALPMRRCCPATATRWGGQHPAGTGHRRQDRQRLHGGAADGQPDL
mgnify:CR=1 FL=1